MQSKKFLACNNWLKEGAQYTYCVHALLSFRCLVNPIPLSILKNKSDTEKQIQNLVRSKGHFV